MSSATSLNQIHHFLQLGTDPKMAIQCLSVGFPSSSRNNLMTQFDVVLCTFKLFCWLPLALQLLTPYCGLGKLCLESYLSAYADSSVLPRALLCSSFQHSSVFPHFLNMPISLPSKAFCTSLHRPEMYSASHFTRGLLLAQFLGSTSNAISFKAFFGPSI